MSCSLLMPFPREYHLFKVSKCSYLLLHQLSYSTTSGITRVCKLNESESVFMLCLCHSYQSKLSKTGSSLDFPSLLFPAHAQYTLCTCSVKGFPSLLCLHMLSPLTQMHNFQGKSSPAATKYIISRSKQSHSKKLRICPEKLRICPEKLHICHEKLHIHQFVMDNYDTNITRTQTQTR